MSRIDLIRALRLSPLLLLLVTGGCVRFHHHASHKSVEPLAAAFATEIAYEKSQCSLTEERVLQSNDRFKILRISFQVPFAETNKTLELDCYIPAGRTNLPVVMLLPISGGGYFLERHFAEYFVKHDFAAIIVHREKGPKNLDNPDPNLINVYLRQSVIDNSRVVDWIETRPEFDPKKIAVMGTSMGGIKGSLFVAVEPRIRAAALGLAGGDLPYVMTYSTERGIARRRKAYLEKHQMTEQEFRKILEEAVVWDPKKLAQFVDPNKVLLILGACDTAVPFKKGDELRRAMGKPETVIVMSGHYSALFYILYIQHSALEFFHRRFAH